MRFKFRDLYGAVKETRQAITDMGLDVDNVLDGEGKCILTDEQDRLRESYLDLYNADVKMKEDIEEIRRKIDRCIACLDVY
ncbi:hypothetical protein SECTIM467_87 [Brevibacillus phage SecTim467]|uniref:Uncharacterized protein n=2 Tax=Jenstvirus jenst TaxID=1982225 RepID=A0A0K2CNT1_9CAUD|nr:hypothetical protein AVV11_gp109 [Brevibacillus phage Jenst]ALA07211.1 hypothetical protein JENST_82 [Brevibacillus phage Jenst]ALA07431.1 hypothetical protein SECTIM467_87 [Brevibacillus phage SecTim467]